jgi:hypothetical protein
MQTNLAMVSITFCLLSWLTCTTMQQMHDAQQRWVRDLHAQVRDLRVGVTFACMHAGLHGAQSDQCGSWTWVKVVCKWLSHPCLGDCPTVLGRSGLST